MSILLVTGTLGGGKSAYGTRVAYEALRRGKVVVTNLALVDDFPERVAREQFQARIRGREEEWARSYRARYLHSDDLDVIRNVRARGTKEARGVVILDEAHNWLNSRMWSGDDRKDLVRYFTQTRKMGFDVYLISQLPEAIDKQVRGVFEFEINVRNLQHFKGLFGLSIFPRPLSLAIKTWHHESRVVAGREFFNPRRYGRYYDTMALSHGEVADDGKVWLPRHAEPLAAPGAVSGLPASTVATDALPSFGLPPSVPNTVEHGHAPTL